MNNLNNTSRMNTIWNKSFINVFILNLTMNMAQYMINVLIPKYADYLGANATLVGVISGMFAVTALSVRPVVGSAIIHIKKNHLMAAAIGFVMFAFICYGLANSTTMIIIGRLAHGIGMGFMAPLGLTLASDALPEKKMASGIGIFTLGQAISTAIGPTLGLFLTDLFGYNITFFIGAIMMSLSFIIALRLTTEEPDAAGKFKISFNNVIDKEVIIPAIIMLFLSGAYSSINGFLVIYAEISNVSNIGLFFTVYAISVLLSRPFSGRIADKYGLDKILIPGMLIFALAFIIISISHSLPMFLLAGVISAFGYGICQPVMQTLSLRLVSNERRGVAGNTTYIGVDTGNLIVPILAGTIVTSVQNTTGSGVFGYEVMYRVMVIPVLIALAIFLIRRKVLLQKVGTGNQNDVELADNNKMSNMDSQL